MHFETIIVNNTEGIHHVTFNRLEHRNSINRDMLLELNKALDYAESDSSCKLFIMEGQNGVFCTGMDFELFVSGAKDTANDKSDDFSDLYMGILRRLSLSPKIIISKVDGQVMAGGIGLIAASDIVLSTTRSQFSLTEILWGLLPAMVTPYLIRKVGFQKAYYMTLTSITVSAQEAYRIHLVDEVDDNLNTAMKRMSFRLLRLDETTIKEMKEYFREMWIITDQIEKKAVEKITYLASKKDVVDNIVNFIKFRRFPWEKL